MPEFVTGNLWDELDPGGAEIVLVTTNATLRNGDNGLVMGRGAALEVKERFPGIDAVFGCLLQAKGLYHWQRYAGPRATAPYGVLLTPVKYQGRSLLVGAFQVKWHFKDKADLALIAWSAGTLNGYLRATTDRNGSTRTVALNFPGIGNGGLTKEEVAPLLLGLPDTVRIYDNGQGGKAQGLKTREDAL